MPRQIPKKGILFSLANLIASILPEIPLLPNPPGISMPFAFFKRDLIVLELIVSESNHLIFTSSLLWTPA